MNKKQLIEILAGVRGIEGIHHAEILLDLLQRTGCLSVEPTYCEEVASRAITSSDDLCSVCLNSPNRPDGVLLRDCRTAVDAKEFATIYRDVLTLWLVEVAKVSAARERAECEKIALASNGSEWTGQNIALKIRQRGDHDAHT